jgi:hypothetical protein
MMKTFRSFACAVFALSLAQSASAAPEWPTVASPEKASSVAQQMNLNGLPMRIQVFSSSKSVSEVVDFYRRTWGEKHVENKLRQTVVLGRGEGGFYTTVQLTPTAAGVSGVIAVTDLKAAASNAQRLPFKPPLSSKVLSDMESEDAGKTSRHTVFTNTHSLDVNRERITQMLKEKGLVLEQEGKSTNGSGNALFFRGGKREATAVISRNGDQTAVVLNVVTSLNESK